MKKATKVGFVLVVFLLFLNGAVASQNGVDKIKESKKEVAQSKVRLLAQTQAEIEKATENGCTVVRQTKGLSAFECSSNVAPKLGLSEDLEMEAVDTGANTQIKADTVQASGNKGQGRKIVILDTGYNYNNPDLKSSFLGGYDFINSDDDPMDDNGHGSHVAGIITGDGIDAKAKGVAPEAGVISGKILDSSGKGHFSDMVAAIYWAIDGPDGKYGTADDPHADAISISIGTGSPQTYSGTCDDEMPSLTEAIKYAHSKGTAVVVAAGNNGKEGVSLPGCISYVTSVGAVDSSNKLASFSGIGSAVDVVAPGVNIYSTYLDTQYKSMSGTSMATPVVSGVVALIKEAHPGFTVTQVQDALYKTATKLPAKSSSTQDNEMSSQGTNKEGITYPNMPQLPPNWQRPNMPPINWPRQPGMPAPGMPPYNGTRPGMPINWPRPTPNPSPSPGLPPNGGNPNSGIGYGFGLVNAAAAVNYAG